jgi:ATP-binding cassette, subfamily B, vacuolar membrane transporter HMT1/ACLQ
MAAPGTVGMSDAALSSDALETARSLLFALQIASPIALLLAFVTAFIVCSILSARQLAPAKNTACGPGGRPLPTRTRSTMAILKDRQNVSPRFRLVFQGLSLAVLVTFLVDAAINVSHAILYRSQHWWRGQATVVSFFETSH